MLQRNVCVSIRRWYTAEQYWLPRSLCTITPVGRPAGAGLKVAGVQKIEMHRLQLLQQHLGTMAKTQLTSQPGQLRKGLHQRLDLGTFDHKFHGHANPQQMMPVDSKAHATS